MKARRGRPRKLTPAEAREAAEQVFAQWEALPERTKEMDGILSRRQDMIEHKLPADDPFFGLDRLHAIVAATARSKRPDWVEAFDQWLTPNREMRTQWAIAMTTALLEQYEIEGRAEAIARLCADNAAVLPGGECTSRLYQLALDGCWSAKRGTVSDGSEPADGGEPFARRFRNLLLEHTAKRVLHDERRSRPSAMARTVVAALITHSAPEAVRKRQKRSPTAPLQPSSFRKKLVLG